MKLSGAGFVGKFFFFFNWFKFITRNHPSCYLFLPDWTLRDYTFLGIYPFLLGCPLYWYIIILLCKTGVMGSLMWWWWGWRNHVDKTCSAHSKLSIEGGDLLKDVFSTFLSLKKSFSSFSHSSLRKKLILFLHDNCIFMFQTCLPVARFHFLWFSSSRLQKASPLQWPGHRFVAVAPASWKQAGASPLRRLSNYPTMRKEGKEGFLNWG